MTKTPWIVIWMLTGLWWVSIGMSYVFADYNYEKQFLSYWTLADKASRLDQKSDYIEGFVKALKASGLSGSYDAVWLETPDNSFDKNLEALESLQSRMEEIKGMNIKSFEYQQAISQITAQEQGEAKKMLEVFEGCWYLRNHFLIWDWVGAINIILSILLAIAGLIVFLAWLD